MEKVTSRFRLLEHKQNPTENLLDELYNNGLTVTFAEGCSGGSIGDTFTIAGSTRAVHMGGTFYSTDSKIRQLGISQKDITTYGEYSHHMALLMSQAILQKSGASLAIATVGELEPQNPQIPYVHIAYTLKGRDPWIKTLLLKEQTRNLQKAHISSAAVSYTRLYLNNQHLIPHQDHYAMTHLIPSDKDKYISTELHHATKNLIATLHQQGLRVATMESCTGGAIANAITDFTGATGVLDVAHVTYDENAKKALGVPPTTMAYGNVYSEAVAGAMAEGALINSSADIALATTGTLENPDTRPWHTDILPGTVYIAVSKRTTNGFETKTRALQLIPTTRAQMKREVSNATIQFAQELLQQTIEQNAPTRFLRNYPLYTSSCVPIFTK